MDVITFQTEFAACCDLRRQGRQGEAKQRLIALEAKWERQNGTRTPYDKIDWRGDSSCQN